MNKDYQLNDDKCIDQLIKSTEFSKKSIEKLFQVTAKLQSLKYFHMFLQKCV